MKPLIFDMDGVLVDPTYSYRAATIETIAHFSGRLITQETIAAMKNRGGYNDDCVLVADVLRGLGVEINYDCLRKQFHKLFWGFKEDGLVIRECWLVEDGILGRLATTYRLAIYTGRPTRAAHFTLRRFAEGIVFDPVITSDLVEHQKPAPDGLLRVLESFPDCEATYVGDNIDDARCARAAGVAFVGVAASNALRRDEIVQLFTDEGAQAVVESVNELESALCEL